jgi:hypothetical protein
MELNLIVVDQRVNNLCECYFEVNVLVDQNNLCKIYFIEQRPVILHFPK